MSISVKTIEISFLRDCFILLYPSAYECADAFFRIDQIIDNKKLFINRHITREELLDKYMSRTGHTDYKQHWAGFYVHAKSIYRVLNNCNDLSDKERELKIVCFENDIQNEDTVIACVKGDKLLLDHEIAHAFYDNNEDYKKLVNNILSDVDLTEFKEVLIDTGYTTRNNQEAKDELHAFIISGISNLQIDDKLKNKLLVYKKPLTKILKDAIKGKFNREKL